MLTQSVDAFTGEHQQTMFHHVNLDHGQRRAGLKRHRVHSEIEGGIGGEESADMERIVRQKALMRVEFTPLGAATVRCPYCLVQDKVPNPVDVTRFVDQDGKKEVKTSCSRGHVLRFRPIPQWQEERIRAGVHKPL